MLSFKVLDSNKSLEVQKTLEDNVTTKGHKVVFTYRDELESFKIMQVYTVFKNKLYVLTYIAEFEKYSVYLPSIEGIMNSFKIINAMEYDKKDFLQYMDSTIGLKISYPYDWGKIKATNREVLFISPDKKIYFSIFTGIAQGRSLEAIAGGIINDDKIRANKLINPISEIIESKGTIVSGDPAYYRVNFYTDNALISPEDPLRHPEIKGIQIFTVAGDIRYSFLFFARDDVYSNYWPSIKKMIDSIQIKDNIVTSQAAIKVNGSAIDLAFNPNTNLLYVATQSPNSILVIDGSKNIVVQNVTLDVSPDQIELNPNTNMLYVISRGDNRVYVIDASINKINSKIIVGPSPTAAYVDPGDYGIKSGTYSTIFLADADQNVIYVIDGSTNTVVGNVTVGNNPESIAIDLITNKLYVSNINSNTVSVIDYLRDSQEPVFVGKLVKNITGFEDPLRVAVDPIINNVYVINRNNDTISVIDGSTYNIIGNIAVGTFPSHMAVNTNSHTLYVITVGSIYIISGTTNTVVGNITVSGEPNEIILNLKENILYENHAEYGTVSVVNTTTNNVAVGLTFSINPPNSGNIICHDQIISSSKHIMYDIDTDITCNANPNNNFVFNSWSGDIYDNSNNKLITESRVADAYPNDGTTDVIKFRASQFGTLTANFIRSNQVSIPPEFWAPLYGIIPAIITGIFIPSIISWLNGRRQRTHLRQYIDNIGKLDKDTIEKNITNSYTQGKISESHYQMLKERISEYYRNSSKDRL